MIWPIPVDKCEELIYYYVRCRYKLYHGTHIKLSSAIAIKARELGFAASTAWIRIRLAKEIGMIDET